MNHRGLPYFLACPAGIFSLGLLAGPLLLLVRVSLCEQSPGHGFFSPGTWTLVHYHQVLDSFGLRLVGFTVAFGLAISAITVAIAYPFVLAIRTLSPSVRRLILFAVLIPKLTSVLVILFGLQQILGEAGVVRSLLLQFGVLGEDDRLYRNLFGAIVGEASLVLPYSILILYVQVLAMDPNLEAAARGLGGTESQVFWRVTLPLSRPGLVLAAQLGFLWGMGAFLGPMLLGGPEETTLAMEIHRQAFEYSRWPRAAALAIVLLAAALAGVAVFAYRFSSSRSR